MSRRGFVLQPTYRIQEGRPVIHLYGLLEDGSPCLLRDNRFVPRFYILEEDHERAQELGVPKVFQTTRTSLRGQPLLRVELQRPGDTPRLRNRLIQAGVACFEADVPFASLYLIERGIKAGFEVSGEPGQQPGVGWVWENPELRPARVAPSLRRLSIDIETDPLATRLLSIALYASDYQEVLLLADSSAYSRQLAATCFRSELDLLKGFQQRVVRQDPDVLTGWNLIDFDLKVLDRISRRLGHPLQLGRDQGALRMQRARTPWSSHDAVVPGRQILDGIDLLRSSFIRMEEYSLEFVARKVLGEGKTIQESKDKAEDILRLYQENPAQFVEYNLTDARLALEICEKLGVFELAVERSLLTGLPVNRVGASIASFDFLYLSELHRKGQVADSVQRVQPLPPASNEGGYVLEPVPGLYEQVLVFDFKSLYPSIIRTFQIDPLGRLEEESPAAIGAPNGARFSREHGILPGILDELFPRREEAKRKGDRVGSHAIKILMNSFYGVLGTSACRFYHPQLAGAITSFGRKLLLWSKARLEEWHFEVLYGDTDSLFIRSGARDTPQAISIGEELVSRLNRALADYVERKWAVKSHLELEFERVYQKLHFPAVRHGLAGARKRYAGLIEEEGSSRIRFVGMEVVRRDWTELAKQVQRELYHRLFHQLPVEDYLGELIDRLKRGELDDWLVYRKGLRKKLDAYTSTTPPHVAAARKLSNPPDSGTIAYLMTGAGPEPLQALTSPIDYEHYIQRQIRPVATPILELLGLHFSRLIGESYQLRLFE